MHLKMSLFFLFTLCDVRAEAFFSSLLDHRSSQAHSISHANYKSKADLIRNVSPDQFLGMYSPLLPQIDSQGMPSLSRSNLELPARKEATASLQLLKDEQFCAMASPALSTTAPSNPQANSWVFVIGLESY